MMRKRTVLALVVVAFVAGLLSSNLIPQGLAVEKDSVDRTPYELYPFDEYDADRYIELWVEDKYYHQHDSCPFCIKQGAYLNISLYEAVDRGFLPCPNCFYEWVEIR